MSLANGGTLKYVGRRTKRSDAPERLTGKLRFAADLPLPGMLHARLVLSPYAAARIVAIATDVARELPGVDGELRVRGVPDKSVGLPQIYRMSTSFGGKHPAVQGRGQSVVDQQAPGFAVHIARVHVTPKRAR